MSGLVVFTSLREALNAGYHVYGRTERGYLARLRTDRGWALALVECIPAAMGTNGSMERDETQTNLENDESAKEAEDARKGDRKLEDYDKTMADSFPASDPPAQP